MILNIIKIFFHTKLHIFLNPFLRGVNKYFGCIRYQNTKETFLGPCIFENIFHFLDNGCFQNEFSYNCSAFQAYFSNEIWKVIDQELFQLKLYFCVNSCKINLTAILQENDKFLFNCLGSAAICSKLIILAQK